MKRLKIILAVSIFYFISNLNAHAFNQSSTPEEVYKEYVNKHRLFEAKIYNDLRQQSSIFTILENVLEKILKTEFGMFCMEDGEDDIKDICSIILSESMEYVLDNTPENSMPKDKMYSIAKETLDDLYNQYPEIPSCTNSYDCSPQMVLLTTDENYRNNVYEILKNNKQRLSDKAEQAMSEIINNFERQGLIIAQKYITDKGYDVPPIYIP